jgi:hypothetical protein
MFFGLIDAFCSVTAFRTADTDDRGDLVAD